MTRIHGKASLTTRINTIAGKDTNTFVLSNEKAATASRWVRRQLAKTQRQAAKKSTRFGGAK